MDKRAMSQGMIVGIIVGVVILVVIGSFLIFNSPEGSSTKSISRLSSEEKDIEYAAEVTCMSYEFSQKRNDLDGTEYSEQADLLTQQFTKDLASIVDKYEFTMTEAYGISQKYSEDEAYFNKVLKRVKVLCPEGYSELIENPPGDF